MTSPTGPARVPTQTPTQTAPRTVVRATGRLIRAMAATGAILGIVAGVPPALWLVGRELAATHWTAWADLWAIQWGADQDTGWGGIGAVLGVATDMVARPDNGGLLLTLVLGVAGLAWMVLTYAILVEVVAVLTRRPAPRINLPGFRASRAVAAVLVGAALSAGSTSAWAAPITDATTGTSISAAHHPAAVHENRSGEPATDAPGQHGPDQHNSNDDSDDDRPRYLVRGRDTFWGIAERVLGTGKRWVEIRDLNIGVVQPDGATVTDSDLLRPGWVLILPTDAAPSGEATCTVRSGDTLTGIAAARLGNPAHSQALFDRNRGLVQPDGRSLQSPNLIRPGWRLVLPDITNRAVPGPLPDRPHDQAPEWPPRPPIPPRTQAQPLPPTPPPEPTAPNVPQHADQEPDTSAATGAGAGAGLDDGPGADRAGDAEREQPADSAGINGVVVPAGIGSTLLLIGLAGVLAVRRRRQVRLRRPRHRIPTPRRRRSAQLDWAASHPSRDSGADAGEDGGHRDFENQFDEQVDDPSHPDMGLVDYGPDDVAVGAGESFAATGESDDVDEAIDWTFLDTALRSLVLAQWEGVDAPALQMVVLEPGRALLTIPALLPGPFTPIADGDVWELHTDTVLPLTTTEANGYCAPFPTLVSIGTDISTNTGIELDSRTSFDSSKHGDDRLTDDRLSDDQSEDRGGSVLLVDLEEIGVAHVTGEPDAALGLLRHIAAELATAPWAEEVEILLAGFGAELVELNPDRLRTVDLTGAIAAISGRARAAASTLGELGLDTVLHGRLRPVAMDAWVPIVLLATGPATDADRAALHELATELGDAQRRPAAVITAGVTLAGQEIHITGDDTLLTAGIGDGWRAAHLSVTNAEDLAGVLAPTHQPDQPVGPAREPQPWAVDMAEDGGLAPHPGDALVLPDWSLAPPPPLAASPPPPLPLPAEAPDPPRRGGKGDDDPAAPPGGAPAADIDGDGKDDADNRAEDEAPDEAKAPILEPPALPGPMRERDSQQAAVPHPPPVGTWPAEPAQNGDAAGNPDVSGSGAGQAVGEQVNDAAVPAGAAVRLAAVERQDPHLDRDLQRWQAASDQALVPLLGILGIPQVRAPGPTPAARVSRVTEVLIYLALRPLGVTPDQAQTDLWPDGKLVQDTTIRSAIYSARRWAGRGLDGDPAEPFVSELNRDGVYRLRGHVLDWDLFRRLRKRAHARRAAAHPGALADYTAAVELVRGPVLSPLPQRGYGWLADHPDRPDLQIPGWVIDTAHELVDLALAAGDTATARSAAEISHLVDPDIAYDRPLLDLMRVAHAEDQQAEMERYATMLIQARDPEDDWDDWPQESFDLLNELVPHRLRNQR